jgi:N-acetylmuramic acid 6-phosphate etherase
METERASPRYSGIDLWAPSEILDAMIEAQFAAVAATRAARPSLERAARAMEARIRYRGRLVYAGAGTSGRLAVQDGAELMPTFSWPEQRLVLLMAGGREALLRSVEGAEDEVSRAQRLIRQHVIDSKDALIAVAANDPVHPGMFARGKAARSADDRDRQQSRHASAGGGRSPHLARHRR